MEKKIKAIIFDMDGTLYAYNSLDEVYIGSSMQKNIHENKIKILNSAGITNSLEVNKILKKAKESKSDTSEFLSQYLNLNLNDVIYSKMDIDDSFLSKDQELFEFLDSLKLKDILLFISTGSPKRWSDKCLSKLKITHFFLKVFNNNYYPEKKKKSYKRILLEYDLNLDEVLVVGDNKINDIVPAQEIGINTIFCKRKDLIDELKHFL